MQKIKITLGTVARARHTLHHVGLHQFGMVDTIRVLETSFIMKNWMKIGLTQQSKLPVKAGNLCLHEEIISSPVWTRIT